MFFNKKNKIDKNSKIVKIENGKIPTNEIENEDNITFVVITQDDKTLEKTISSIVKVQQENPNKNFTVVISSSYEKLHKITKGAL